MQPSFRSRVVRPDNSASEAGHRRDKENAAKAPLSHSREGALREQKGRAESTDDLESIFSKWFDDFALMPPEALSIRLI
jgi:hypothetical protein